MSLNDNFENCYNYLIANDYKQAYYNFSENYYKYPQDISYFYGLLISFILQDNINEAIHFMEKEIEVSPLHNKIRLLLYFIKRNGKFSNLKKVSVLLNIGLFLRKNGLSSDAKLFFNTVLLLEPENRKASTVIAESALLEDEIKKSLSLYSQAAKIK